MPVKPWGQRRHAERGRQGVTRPCGRQGPLPRPGVEPPMAHRRAMADARPHPLDPGVPQGGVCTPPTILQTFFWGRPHDASAGPVWSRFWSEIVFPQMTKTDVLTPGARGDHIPDLHLLIGDDHPVDAE